MMNGLSPRPSRPGPGRGAARVGLEHEDPRDILTAISAVVYEWDLGSDHIAWGRNAAEVLGVGDMAAWSRGADFAALVVPGSGTARGEIIADAPASVGDAGSGTAYSTRYALAAPAGGTVLVEDAGRWFAGHEGRAAYAKGLLRVVPALAQDAVAAQGRLRSEFLAGVRADMADAGTTDTRLTLFAMSIGNLAELNEELGFDAADRVIAEVLRRMRGAMRHRDRFAHHAGNRFVLLLRGCDRGQAAVAAERLVRLVCAEPIETAGPSAFVRLAIGGATSPDHAADAAALLRRAEESLEAAKRRPGAPFVLYEARAIRRRPRTQQAAALDCAQLLNARRITLARQPVIEARSRAVVFHEALLRVETEDGRIRAAGDVVPTFERTGLIALADIRMLELVAGQLAADPALRLSVNVAPRTLESPDWLASLAAHLAGCPGIGERLIVEMTETGAVHDPDATRRQLEAVKSLGPKVAIDDFGAGHTSFRHLRTFPVDFLKIDGVFVQNTARQPRDGFFVRTLIDLAANLGIATVAEWVEDEATAALLAGWGVDLLQGDHCGRPELVRPRPVASAVAAA